MEKLKWDFVPVPKGIYRQLKGNELKLFTYLIENVTFYESIGKTFKKSLREISKDLDISKDCSTINTAKKALKEKGLIDYVDGVYGGDTVSTLWYINRSAFSQEKPDCTVRKIITEQSGKPLLNSQEKPDIYKNTNKNTILDYQPEYQTASLDENFERELWS